jgi:integrase
MEFAVKEKLIKTDPTAGIKIKLPKSDGHHTTTEEEIAQYKAHHAFGTKARLGLELGLQQGMRRSDVIRVGPPHLKDGEITIKHYKTGMPVTLTVSPDLAKAIAMCSTIGVQTFLTRDNGRPYDEKRYNTDFRKWCNEADLPEHCVPHGLRKSFTCRLLEAGAEVGDVAAAGGWTSLARVQHYAKEYDRKKASRRAMAKLAAHSATPEATAGSAS